jgi:hypothetical protein
VSHPGNAVFERQDDVWIVVDNEYARAHAVILLCGWTLGPSADAVV